MAIRIVLVLLLLGGAASAAPPTVTHLFPAGGQAGTTAKVTAFGTFERWPVRAWVEGKGVEVAAGKEKGELSVTIAADAVPGPRWLRLIDEHGASTARRFLVGTLPETREKEPNDDVSSAQAVTAPVVVNGRLVKAGDVDCFALQLRQGQTLVASLDAQRSLASPMDGVLQVVSDRGFVLARNNDYAGLDPQVTFRVPTDGRYVIRVFAFPATPDASVRFAGGDRFLYRLTLTTAGFADHAFPLAVERANPSPVELVGWNFPPAARKAVLEPRGDDEATAFHHEAAGTVSVRREPHPCVVHTRPGNPKSPQEIRPPVTVSGQLEKPGEAHAFRFQARKGQTLLFQVESANLGFAVDPVVKVTSADGEVVSKTSAPTRGGRRGRARAAAGAGDTTFAVPSDGLYQLELRDLFEDGGPRHLYRLRALVAKPDFGLTVPRDQFFLTPGKTVDIPVTIDKRHGFQGAVELATERLPEGVRAETVSGTILRLSAGEKATSSGPLRIVGRAKGKPAAAHVAQAALADYGVSVSHLWLHVGPTTAAPPPPAKKRR